jgi:acetoacetate decarboxylase
VRSEDGTIGHYVPYMYLTAIDAAMAVGREVFGFTKKLAKIEMTRRSDLQARCTTCEMGAAWVRRES